MLAAQMLDLISRCRSFRENKEKGGFSGITEAFSRSLDDSRFAERVVANALWNLPGS